MTICTDHDTEKKNFAPGEKGVQEREQMLR